MRLAKEHDNGIFAQEPRSRLGNGEKNGQEIGQKREDLP